MEKIRRYEFMSQEEVERDRAMRPRLADMPPEAQEKEKLRQRERVRKRRMDVIAHYGGKCDCCGESQIEFLCIDHTDGNGREDRMKHRASTNFYDWLIKNDFPPGYRVLCYNCNSALGAYGYCPHKGKGEVLDPAYHPRPGRPRKEAKHPELIERKPRGLIPKKKKKAKAHAGSASSK